MRVNEYKILRECVERGVSWGLIRAVKHTDTPSEEARKETIIDAVMLEIGDNFIFLDNPEQTEQV